MTFGIPGQGQNPLAYLDNRLSDVPAIRLDRAPTEGDNNYPLMTFALDESTGDVYVLYDYLYKNRAQWQLVTSGTGDIVEITLDDGNTITPNAGNVDLLGQDTPSQNGVETFQVSSYKGGFRMKSPFTLEDFTYSTDTPGDTRTVTVTNSDNTNTSSNAAQSVTTGGTSGGDPYYNLGVGSTISYCMGIDNTDSDLFKINTDTAGSVTPSTGTNLVNIDSSGNTTIIGRIIAGSDDPSTATTGVHYLNRSSNNTVTGGDALWLRGYSTGTPGTGFGTGITIWGDNDTNVLTVMGAINTQWTDATTGSEDAKMNFNLCEGGSSSTRAILFNQAFKHPSGTTAERPGTPVNGMIRYNETANYIEGYSNSTWVDLTSGGGGGSTFADNVFRVYDNGDNTKNLAFECSGITTSTTRTITMANQNLNLTPNTGTYPAAAGGTQITTLGTISTGTWNGTTVGEVYGGTGQATYATGDILYASASNTLNKLTAGTDGHVLTLASGVPTWAASAGGTPPPKEYSFPAESFSMLETNFAPLERLVGGTNGVAVFVRAFDDTTEEYANGKLMVPSDIDTSGTVTFRAYVMAKTAAASKNCALTFSHIALNNSEDFDGTYTDEDSGDFAIDATQDDVTEVTWTETVSNLGWAASDMVLFRVSRPQASADNLSGDMYLFAFEVSIPRS